MVKWNEDRLILRRRLTDDVLIGRRKNSYICVALDVEF